MTKVYIIPTCVNDDDFLMEMLDVDEKIWTCRKCSSKIKLLRATDDNDNYYFNGHVNEQ